MKTLPVVVLAALSVAFAGFADAAPKKRTRNANRVGPYGMGFVGQTSFTSDHSADEQDIFDNLDASGNVTPVVVKTEDTDIGYNATFGYRFNRYLAAELGLAQFGSLTIQGSADLARPSGTVPGSLKLEYAVGGPMFSAIGIFPVNEKFEIYGRLGYLFTATEIEFSSRLNGDLTGFGTAKGDSQDMVLGVGVAWNFNQVYAARLEYQQLEVGEEGATGTQDLNVIGLGVVVRF
jgi:opacity protein-like surface antigen